MGRDVTGLHASSVKAKPNGVSEATDAVLKEGKLEVAPDENSNAKHNDILGVKSPNLEDAKNDVKFSPEKSGIGMTAVENVQTKHIVQTEETPVLCRNTSPNTNTLHSPSSSKKSQSNTPFVSRKHLDDEDNWSMTSSYPSCWHFMLYLSDKWSRMTELNIQGFCNVRTARCRTTVPVAPKFTVSERLEKRKEFYAILEEKHKALEAEKREYEARNKEEEQAAIKQLRKTMAYKANPVPSFYYEGPSPKKELKKLPTTRAVSPKLGRRKSCGDAASSSSEEKVVCARAIRHSLGNPIHNHKQGSVAPTSTPKKKGLAHEQSGGKGSLKKERPKQLAKVSASAPAKQPVRELGPESAPAPAPAPAQEQDPVQEPEVPQDMNQQINTDISVKS